jgi:CheY-like chemotaxis protein
MPPKILIADDEQSIVVPLEFLMQQKGYQVMAAYNGEEAIEKIFAEKIELKKEDFEQITTEVCGVPKFFKNMLFDRIDSGKTGKITKPHFLQFWKRDFQNADIHKRIFKIIAKPDAEYMV